MSPVRLVYKSTKHPFRWGRLSQLRWLCRSCRSLDYLAPTVWNWWAWPSSLLPTQTSHSCYFKQLGTFFSGVLLQWLLPFVYLFLVSFQIYPHRFPGAAGVNPAQVATRIVANQLVKNVKDFFFFFLTLSFFLQPFPTHGFIKYSIPQPPGRQSVEVVNSLWIKSC